MKCYECGRDAQMVKPIGGSGAFYAYCKECEEKEWEKLKEEINSRVNCSATSPSRRCECDCHSSENKG